MVQKPSALTSTALYQTPVLQTDNQGKLKNNFNWSWVQNFMLAGAQILAPVSTTQIPASSSAPTDKQPQLATDGTYLFIAIGENQWKRILLSAF